MKIALFGGTFDPVHLGHLAVARTAVKRFGLELVYFVPADVPPHKQKRRLTDFHHRFAMLALATAEEPHFVPSLLDAPVGQPNYSINTVRRLKKLLKKGDKVYFLIGMDAFQDIATWRQPEELLAECDFIVASRPGYSLADVGRALPGRLRPSDSVMKALGKPGSRKTIALPGAKIHLLPEVKEGISSTQIRAAADRSLSQLNRYVPRLVGAYIRKERLYLGAEMERGRQAVGRGKVLSFENGKRRIGRH